jgi:hypothetical protein
MISCGAIDSIVVLNKLLMEEKKTWQNLREKTIFVSKWIDLVKG